MNQAIIQMTEQRLTNNNELSTFVNEAKKFTIPLVPEVMAFTRKELKAGFTIVNVDIEKDTYPVDGGKKVLHLAKINEIAQAAGLQIVDSKLLERQVDEKGLPILIIHQITWRMKSVDGSIKQGVATGKYDYYRDVAKYEKEGQIRGRRNHAEALAESNAMTRAYNKAISKLPQTFTAQELSKPFLVPYVIEDPDELLKELPVETRNKLKEKYAMKQLGLLDTIYNKKSTEEAEVINIIDDDKDNDDDDMTVAEKNKIIAQELLQTPQAERTEKILDLCKLKGRKHPNGEDVTSELIEKQTPEKQLKFIESLLNSPDAVMEDLPC